MLGDSFHTPSYLFRILRDYLKARSVPYEKQEGQRRMEITSGVAQGSMLEPLLCYASYDSLLTLVSYADDVAALVAGCTVEQAQSRLGILMQRVSGWVTAHGFSRALEKNRNSHLYQKENPDPVSYIDRRVDYKVKTSG